MSRIYWLVEGLFGTFFLPLTTETLIEYDKSYIECVVFSRHEVPVTSQPITIVFMDDDIVVVNKPASIPVSGFWDRHYIFFFYYSYFYPIWMMYKKKEA